MKVAKIKIINYRLLKNFELDLENELSLVIGKNNCGKTSLLSILDKFIGNKSQNFEFSFDDFNIDFKNELKKCVESIEDIETPFPFLGISLKLFITYSDTDNLANVSSIMMDLDPNNKTIVLAFEYSLTEDGFKNLKKEFADFTFIQSEKEKLKIANNPNYVKPENEKPKDLFYFLKVNHSKYFKSFKKTVEFDIATSKENDKIYIDLVKEKVDLKSIINFKFISAKRDVSNKEPDKALSSLSSKIYKKTEANEKELKRIKRYRFTIRWYLL
jgi:putative ATP-dependent endonuclease of OLD family